jgi:2-iminobutanoate/2-iminopropanoate deaminase
MSIINSDQAPKAIGPYSQAVKKGSAIFISGQLPLDPVSMKFAGYEIKVQTRQSLLNLKAIVEKAGGTLRDVVKSTCFLSNMDNFSSFNEVYSEFFPVDPPARSCVEVARLPKEALVEIEAIAIVE